MISIGTDGSCWPNPGPGGWAWVAEDGRYEAGSFSDGTNNIGELTAIMMALLAFPDEAIEIQSDSEYAIGCITTWGPNWRQSGQTGRSNQKFIFEIMDIYQSRPEHAAVLWTKVKGHDKNNAYPLNTTVDILANSMISKPDGYIESGITKIITGKPPKRKPQQGSLSNRTAKKHRPDDNKTSTDVTSKVSSKSSETSASHSRIIPDPDTGRRKTDNPHPGTLKTCAHAECTNAIKNHAWGNIQSNDKGWFHQKNGDTWCPEHVPEWVASWRAKKAKRETDKDT